VKKRVRVYITLVSILGIGLGVCYSGAYLLPILQGKISISAHMIWIPLLVCALCRSLPITVLGEEKLDLSVISVLAIYLTQGAPAAVTVYMLSSLFTFDRDEKTRKAQHIFRIGWDQLFFNDATVILAIILPDLILRLIPIWEYGNLTLPVVLIPTVLFSLLTFLINAMLQLILFYLHKRIHPGEIMHMLVGLTPNVISAMPLGLLISYGYSTESYMWFVFLMLFPLLLARYAWKLYLDSERARGQLIQAFINSIEAKDHYTQGHSKRVAEFAVQIAQEMKLPYRHVRLIEQGAILHDIGKIGISDSILNKPGSLTPEERISIQQHPLIGVHMLEEVGLEAEVLEMVRSHHERYDGTGYPEKRPSKELPVGARILCVADAYDAITSDRPYRAGKSQDVAIAILQECKNTQFDPDIVDAFIRSIEKKKTAENN